MSHALIPRVSLILTLVATAATAGAQVQQAGRTGRLVIDNPRATAITEYDAALDAYQNWSFTDGFAHAQRALAMDSTFGLARQLVARYRAGPTAAAERQRGAVDAVRASGNEAIIALAQLAGPEAPAFWNTAVQLMPNDPRVALDRALALAGQPRVDALREGARKFPDHAPTKQWFVFYLMAGFSPPISQADASEALAAANDAVRLAPNSAGAHTALAHVLERTGHDEEALGHLREASSMASPGEYTFALRAEALDHLGRFSEARAALDSAILLTANVTQLGNYQTERALTFLHEGNFAASRAAFDEAIRQAQSLNASGVEASIQAFAALVEAAANNAAAAEAHFAIARRRGLAAVTLADNAVILRFLLRQGPQARAALDDYVRVIDATPGVPRTLRDENVHRMTGLTLVADGKGAEAIPELKQGGTNPYAQLGIIEAYLVMGNRKQADAERTAMLARRDFGVISSADPIARYRGMQKH